MHLPVMVWKDFLTKVGTELNPLVSEERLRISTGFLMMSGDVSYAGLLVLTIAFIVLCFFSLLESTYFTRSGEIL